MKTFIKYGKRLIIFIGIILFISLLTSLINLFGIDSKITYIINIVLTIIVFMLFGIKSGKQVSKKGYLEGIKIGLVLISSLFLINIIFLHSITIKSLIIYAIYITSSIIGGILGINKNK